MAAQHIREPSAEELFAAQRRDSAVSVRSITRKQPPPLVGLPTGRRPSTAAPTLPQLQSDHPFPHVSQTGLGLSLSLLPGLPMHPFIAPTRSSSLDQAHILVMPEALQGEVTRRRSKLLELHSQLTGSALGHDTDMELLLDEPASSAASSVSPHAPRPTVKLTYSSSTVKRLNAHGRSASSHRKEQDMRISSTPLDPRARAADPASPAPASPTGSSSSASSMRSGRGARAAGVPAWLSSSTDMGFQSDSSANTSVDGENAPRSKAGSPSRSKSSSPPLLPSTARLVRSKSHANVNTTEAVAASAFASAPSSPKLPRRMLTTPSSPVPSLSPPSSAPSSPSSIATSLAEPELVPWPVSALQPVRKAPPPPVAQLGATAFQYPVVRASNAKTDDDDLIAQLAASAGRAKGKATKAKGKTPTDKQGQNQQKPASAMQRLRRLSTHIADSLFGSSHKRRLSSEWSYPATPRAEAAAAAAAAAAASAKSQASKAAKDASRTRSNTLPSRPKLERSQSVSASMLGPHRASEERQQRKKQQSTKAPQLPAREWSAPASAAAESAARARKASIKKLPGLANAGSGAASGLGLFDFSFGEPRRAPPAPTVGASGVPFPSAARISAEPPKLPATPLGLPFWADPHLFDTPPSVFSEPRRRFRNSLSRRSAKRDSKRESVMLADAERALSRASSRKSSGQRSSAQRRYPAGSHFESSSEDESDLDDHAASARRSRPSSIFSSLSARTQPNPPKRALGAEAILAAAAAAAPTRPVRARPAMASHAVTAPLSFASSAAAHRARERRAASRQDTIVFPAISSNANRTVMV